MIFVKPFSDETGFPITSGNNAVVVFVLNVLFRTTFIFKPVLSLLQRLLFLRQIVNEFC
jgi:hypothetical protein